VIELAWPAVLLLAPLPWLVRRLLPPTAGGAALRVPFLGGLRELARRTPEGHAPARLLPAYAVWALLLLAAARPQYLGEPVAEPTTGRDLMLAVDISGSMRARDFRLDGQPAARLGVVQAVAGRFIARRTGDRIGLILFGARPHVLAPLTYDRPAAAALLEQAEVALAGEYTALGDALALAVKRLRQRPAESRVVVLLTDGANNTGAVPPRQAARLAAEAGVRVYTIGVGRAESVAAPNRSGPWRSGAQDDLDRQTLEAVARITGGRYRHALDTSDLEGIYRELDRLEPTLGEAARAYRARALYPWPLAAALLLSFALAFRRTGRAPDG